VTRIEPPTPRGRAATARTARQRGLTLVEMAVAAGVLTFILAGITSTLTTSRRHNGMNRERTVAWQAARAQMEEVLAYPDFATLKSVFDGRGFAAGTGTDTLRAQDGDPDGLPGRVTVASATAAGGVAPASGAGASTLLHYVTVEVVWRGAGGNERVELSTLVSDTGTN
jgi:type II secretory pathway pseudopilin PulG